MERLDLGAEGFVVGAFRNWEGAVHCPMRGCGQVLGGEFHPRQVLSLSPAAGLWLFTAYTTKPCPLGLTLRPLPPGPVDSPASPSSSTEHMVHMLLLRHSPSTLPPTLPLAVSSSQGTLSPVFCAQVFSVLQGSGSVSPPGR